MNPQSVLRSQSLEGRTSAHRVRWPIFALAAWLLPTAVLATGGTTFENIAGNGVGLDFSKSPSPEFAVVEAVALESLTTPIPFAQRPAVPMTTGGYPGVAVFDFDDDGDLDLYVSNGPGAPNSLFRNLLLDSGSLTFVDVAESTGVAATDQDSAGVCFGDLDNDGDHDLIVLGRHDENRLFENLGGTFAQIPDSGIEGGTRWSSSCAVGDVDGDGLLDIVVANSADFSDAFGILAVPVEFNEHNQLFRNEGALAFADISVSAGLEDTVGLTPGFEGSPTITWAISIVDIDLDGDQDIVWADDQGGLPYEFEGGVDRGLLHIWQNDGTGVFVDHPYDGTNRVGSWMGLDFGDFDCDGTLDIYGANFGDYASNSLGSPDPLPLGAQASRWLLGNGDGTFTDPGVGDLVSTVFDWGTAVFDYDNDADLDILAHGGLDTSFTAIADNPGTVLQNQGCSAHFTLDTAALAEDPSCTDASGQPIPGCTIHIRRNVRGVAVGDLDHNGFVDVVSVANIRIDPPLPLIPAPVERGGPFDDTAFFVPLFFPTPDGFVWSGALPGEGDLAVEMAADNGNRWAAITVRGSIGDTQHGRVNRDGIGAVVSFTPFGGPAVMSPVVGGSSHLSQHALERVFGLGDRHRGRVEVLWPGGVRNRLYGVRHGERLTLPEIPCSFDSGQSLPVYASCVAGALHDLRAAGVVDRRFAKRLFVSALWAYFEG